MIMDPQNWRPDWIFAMTTLVVRFFGVFVVLGILQIIIEISGAIFRRLTQESTQETPGVNSGSGHTEPLPRGEEVKDQELAAAIGTALFLYESEAEAATTLPTGKGPPSQSSEWAIMGRMAHLQSRVFPGRH